MSSTPISCIPIHVAKRFVKECIAAAGASLSHATDMADLLVAADNRGHFSHGLNRLGKLHYFSSVLFLKMMHWLLTSWL